MSVSSGELKTYLPLQVSILCSSSSYICTWGIHNRIWLKMLKLKNIPPFRWAFIKWIHAGEMTWQKCFSLDMALPFVDLNKQPLKQHSLPAGTCSICAVWWWSLWWLTFLLRKHTIIRVKPSVSTLTYVLYIQCPLCFYCIYLFDDFSF